VVKKVYRAKVEGSRGRGSPKMRWMDGVKADVEMEGLNIEDARICLHDRDRWGRVVHSKHIWAD
jgi:hypothetical protein